jgi:hypothetical protein
MTLTEYSSIAYNTTERDDEMNLQEDQPSRQIL